MRHFRAYRATDTALTFWVRDDAGKRDLSEVESLTVEISRYGRSEDSLVSLTGTSAEDGKVAATLTAATADRELGPGLFRVDVVADDVALLTGVLEVV